MREMRSSIIFLGAILTRYGRARVSFPGGCELGPRPIDLHLAALERMAFSMAESRAKATAENLCGTQELKAPDVVYRAISWLGYVSLSDEPLDFEPLKIELEEEIWQEISEEKP